MMFREKVKVVAVTLGAAGLLAAMTPLALRACSDELVPRAAADTPAPAAVTGKVVRDKDVKAFEAVVVKELTGAVKVGDKATCKAKGWSSTVKQVDSDRVLLEPRELAEAGDAVEFTPDK
jgi:translation elongation factor EF-1alpha